MQGNGTPTACRVRLGCQFLAACRATREFRGGAYANKYVAEISDWNLPNPAECADGENLFARRCCVIWRGIYSDA